MNRLALLRQYFDRLAVETAAAGKFSASGENKIEAAVLAVINGGGAIAAQFWADVKALGGEKSAMVAPLAEAAVAGLAVDGVRWAGAQLKGLFAGKARVKERRAIGKQLMKIGRK